MIVSTLLWINSWRGGFGNEFVTTLPMVIRQNLACRQGRIYEQMVTKPKKGQWNTVCIEKAIMLCIATCASFLIIQSSLLSQGVCQSRMKLEKPLSGASMSWGKSRGCMRARHTPTLDFCTELVLITCSTCELTQILIVHLNVLYRYLNEIDFDGHVLEWIAGWPWIGPAWG